MMYHLVSLLLYCSMDPGMTHYVASTGYVAPPKSIYSTQNHIFMWSMTCGETAANRPNRPNPPIFQSNFETFIHHEGVA